MHHERLSAGSFPRQGGQALPIIGTDATQDFFGVVRLRRLTVAPGARVSLRLGVTHGLASTAGSATAYGLKVIPPNEIATLRSLISNGVYECQTTTVSPLAAGGVSVSVMVGPRHLISHPRRSHPDGPAATTAENRLARAGHYGHADPSYTGEQEKGIHQ